MRHSRILDQILQERPTDGGRAAYRHDGVRTPNPSAELWHISPDMTQHKLALPLSVEEKRNI